MFRFDVFGVPDGTCSRGFCSCALPFLPPPRNTVQHQARLDMRAVFVTPLLVHNCGGWVLPASSLRPYLRSSNGSDLREQKNPVWLPFKHRQGSRLTATPVDGDPPSGALSADDGDGDGGVSMVKARLSKPVGLVLAEKEIGQPGLVVDDMVEGSAKVRLWVPPWGAL